MDICGAPGIIADYKWPRFQGSRLSCALVPVRDAPALAEALARLIADPDMRRRMGERGRVLAAGEFSQERVIAETLAVYREAMA